MRHATLDSRRLAGSAKITSIPSPTGGWNVRDNLAAMPPLDAITMDNFFPDVSGVSLRRGDELFATGLSGDVETLFEFRSPALTQLLAASDGDVYNVTAGGTAVSIGSGFTNGRWQTENYRARAFMANGEDIVQVWDGSTLADATFTGGGTPTLSTLDNVSLARDRLWFVQKDTSNAYYGAVGGITGELTLFAVGEVSRKGKLVAVASWSRDTGLGMDDFTVFIMSGGDLVVYQGDVGTADFTKVGLYNAPDPIGKRCFLNVGGELVIITKGGYAPLSAIMNGSFGPDDALSEKIRGAVSDAVTAGGSLFGWEGMNHPDGVKIVFNVPNANNGYDQHVLNNITRAWGKQSGRDGFTFSEFAGDFYMGRPNQVYKVDIGGIDESRSTEVWNAIGEQWETWALPWGDGGSSIKGMCQQAFNSLENPNVVLGGRTKQTTFVRPFVKGTGSISLTATILSDFQVRSIAANQNTLNPNAATWNTVSETWEAWTEAWGSGDGIAKQNISAGSIGETFSVAMSVDTQETLAWYQSDIIYKSGGLL